MTPFKHPDNCIKGKIERLKEDCKKADTWGGMEKFTYRAELKVWREIKAMVEAEIEQLIIKFKTKREAAKTCGLLRNQDCRLELKKLLEGET